jgi:hypothetical protein
MAVPSAEDALAEIRALLDDRVEVEGSQDMTLYERVFDVVKAYELWSDLAIRPARASPRCRGRRQVLGGGCRERVRRGRAVSLGGAARPGAGESIGDRVKHPETGDLIGECASFLAPLGVREAVA